MDRNGVVSFRHRQSPSADRFLDVFSPPPSDNLLSGTPKSPSPGVELNEHDVFWTGEHSSETDRRSNSSSKINLRQSFLQKEKFGILAALPEDRRKMDRSVLYRKTSIISSSPPVTVSSSPLVPRAIPKPPTERDSGSNNNINASQSMPVRNFQNSAPMRIPMMPRKLPMKGDLADVDIEDDGDDEMLPPHELIARGSGNSSKTTFSMLEGVGRTLKGRDLRQVRNAVMRQTGFLD